MAVFQYCYRRFLSFGLAGSGTRAWRDQMLSAILFVGLVLGFTAAIPSIALAISEGLWSIAAIDVLALCWVATLIFLPKLSFKARALHFLALIYLLGIWFLLKVGVTGLIYLLAFPVICSFLFPLREAVYALLLASTSLLLVGYFGDANLQLLGFEINALLRWVIITVNFSFVSALMTVTCNVLIHRLEYALEAQQKVSASLQQEQESLRAANEELRLTVAAVARLNDIVMILADTEAPDANHYLRIVLVNDAFERHTGYDSLEVLGKKPDFLAGPNTQVEELERIRYAVRSLEAVHVEAIIYSKGGSEFWLEADIIPLANDEGAYTHWVVTGRDISERKKSEEHIQRLAYFDVLTGLPNRRLLHDRLQSLLQAAHRSGMVSAVLYIDLDNFKLINDARGHVVGDALLKQVTQRLLHTLREVDTVARISGDEFVVLLANLSDDVRIGAHMALHVAEKIRLAMMQLFEVDGLQYSSTCSTGVTLLPRENQTADDILREADTAMYRAKSGGRNQVVFFETGMQSEIELRLTMERELSQAMDGGQLQMFIQSQVDRLGTPVGGELLIRWHHPQRGPISPAIFIPVAEESGMILRLGDWVMLQGCLALNQLAEAGFILSLSVNVSPKQFRQPDFVAKVRSVLAQTQADPHHLIFEVTEGLLIDNLHDTIARMLELSTLGIRFSIDDFGTGYSSFSYLKKLPLYELKIDKSFVQDTPGDKNDTAIVQSMLSMAEHLGLRVVAEGVETREQADFLITNGCSCMQGYLFGRPMPLNAWIDLQRKVALQPAMPAISAPEKSLASTE